MKHDKPMNLGCIAPCCFVSYAPYTAMAVGTETSFAVQIRQQQEKVARRRDKVQRIVKACQEVQAAAQLQQVCTAVQEHVPDVEQSCIMVQWMLQEVADTGISGISWNPAKVPLILPCRIAWMLQMHSWCQILPLF